MALLADKSAEVGSNLVQGRNAQSLTFTMPGGVALKVLSVVATINNGAGVAVTPELTIKEASGAVIATKRQGSTIPAGDTGTATFALRLSAEAAAAAGIKFDTTPQSGGYLLVTTTGNNPATSYGIDLQGVDDIRVQTTDIIELDASDILIQGGNSSITGPKTSSFLLSIGGIVIQQPVGSTGDISVTSRDQLLLVSTNLLSAQTNAAMQLGAATTLTLEAGGGIILSLLAAATSVTVKDSGGNAIFRVDENGDLHGKTGKALVFDL